MQVVRWTSGSSFSHSPHLLQGVDHNVVLVTALSSCIQGHEVYPHMNIFH